MTNLNCRKDTIVSLDKLISGSVMSGNGICGNGIHGNGINGNGISGNGAPLIAEEINPKEIEAILASVKQ